MRDRYTIFTVLMIVAGIILSFGCSGGGGGGGQAAGEVQAPSQMFDMVIWGQKVPKDATALPADNSQTEGGKAIKNKVAAKPGAMSFKDVPSYEGVSNSEVVGFFASNIDGTGARQLTPKGSSSLSIENFGRIESNIAPNGDFWSWSRPGIFISNITDPRPRMLISTQELAKKFTDGDKKGLYLLGDLISKDINLDVSSGDLYIIPYSDSTNDYVALLILNVNFIPAETSVENNDPLWLRYDSKTGEFEFIIPAFSTTTYPLAFEGGVSATIELSNTSVAPAKFIYDLTFTTSSDTFYYQIKYDPLGKTHTLINKGKKTAPRYVDVDAWIASDYEDAWMTANASLKNMGYYHTGGCMLYADGMEIAFDRGKCSKEYVGDSKKEDAKKKALACMKDDLSGKKIKLGCAPTLDVTSYVSTSSDLNKILGLQAQGDLQKIAEIDVNLLLDMVSENAAAPWVSCGADPGTTSTACRPVYYEDNKYTIPSSFFGGLFHHPYTSFHGYAMAGDKSFAAYYALDLSTGGVKLIDKEDTASRPGSPYITETSSVPLYFYAKESKSSPGFNAIFVFDPAPAAPVQITDYTPYEIFVERFKCNITQKSTTSCNGINYSRDIAFFSVKDETGISNTYFRTLSDIYAPSAGTGETASAEDTGAETGEENPLGPRWKLAHPNVGHSEVKTALGGLLGDTAIWESNKDGYRYLYRNKPRTDTVLQRISPSTVSSDEYFITISTVPAYKLSDDMVPSAVTMDTNIEEAFACGQARPHATFCADNQEMCMDVEGVKKCVNFYLCSANAPHGRCAALDEYCDNGTCTKRECVDDSANICGDCKRCENFKCVAFTCPAGQGCQGQGASCVGITGGCTTDAQCVAGYKCTEHACVPATSGGCVTISDRCVPVPQIGTITHDRTNKKFTVTWSVTDPDSIVTQYICYVHKTTCANRQTSFSSIYSATQPPPVTSCEPTYPSALLPADRDFCFEVIPKIKISSGQGDDLWRPAARGLKDFHE